jgi:HSP20 family protein
MTHLARRNEFFDELFDFRRSFEDSFNRLLSWPRATHRPAEMFTYLPPVDAWIDRDAKKYFMHVALPGIDPNNVQLHAEGNTLYISGEHETREEKKETDYHLRECTFGRFERSVTLPEGVDTQKINAEYRDGILEITAPVTAAALPRKIEIKSSTSKAKPIAA